MSPLNYRLVYTFSMLIMPFLGLFLGKKLRLLALKGDLNMSQTLKLVITITTTLLLVVTLQSEALYKSLKIIFFKTPEEHYPIVMLINTLGWVIGFSWSFGGFKYRKKRR